MNDRLARLVAVVSGLLFLISSVFPMASGVIADTSLFPRWWGITDMSLAFVLALLIFPVIGMGQPRVTQEVERITYRVYRVLIHGILGLLVVFFLFGAHIVWRQCITGFAWRAWLLLYALPAWIALYGSRQAAPRKT